MTSKEEHFKITLPTREKVIERVQTTLTQNARHINCELVQGKNIEIEIEFEKSIKEYRLKYTTGGIAMIQKELDLAKEQIERDLLTDKTVVLKINNVSEKHSEIQ